MTRPEGERQTTSVVIDDEMGGGQIFQCGVTGPDSRRRHGLEQRSPCHKASRIPDAEWLPRVR